MATKTKGKTRQKPTKAVGTCDAIDGILRTCRGCLLMTKPGKTSSAQREFFISVEAIAGWAREHGYPDKKSRAQNPFLRDSDHMGEITVRQLMEVVSNPTEFPKGLDTVIRIGDVEGNNGTNGNVCLTSHKKGDVVLSIDPNEGDLTY